MKTRRLFAALLGSAMVLSFAGAALAAHDGPLVEPTTEAFPGGDPVCPEGTTAFRWEGADNGDTQGGVTVSWNEAGEVSFEADAGTLVAIATVKGGNDQNVYDYTGFPDGGVDHDNGLIAPDNAGGNQAGVSHVDLCLTTAPATEPPATEPPATEPPATEPPTLPPTATSPNGPETPASNVNLVLGLIVLIAGGLTAFAMRPRRSAQR